MSRYSHLFNAHTALSLSFDIDATGHHTGADNASVLTDGSQDRVSQPFTDDIIGKWIYNFTDGSKGLITARTISTVAATLAGGTGNDWDEGDVYAIGERAVNILEVPRLRELAYEQVSVVTPGTPVSPSSNVSAKAVRVINNNELLETAYCSTIASVVDATASPKVGHPIFPLGDSWVFYVDDDADELEIDSTVAADFDCFILGI